MNFRIISICLLSNFILFSTIKAQDIAMDHKVETIVESEENKAVVEDEETEKTEKAITFSGSIDTYYKAELSGGFSSAPATSFANLPGFALGMANLIASHEGDKVGFTADLVFGPRGEDATFLSSALRPGGSSNIVNQLYAYWKVTDKVKVTLGNFNTFLGYEVISPTANFNYSTSYLFSYGPFSHTGLKLDFDLGNGLSLMTGVFNPTDATEYNPGTLNGDSTKVVGSYTGGAQLGYAFDAGSAYLNAIISDGFYQLDLTAGVDLSDMIYLGLNATTASDNFFGGAVYFQVAASDALKIGARAEYFADKGIGLTTLDESIMDFTLSANYTIGKLSLIPEFRLDTFSAEGSDSLGSFILAAVYGF